MSLLAGEKALSMWSIVNPIVYRVIVKWKYVVFIVAVVNVHAVRVFDSDV